MADKVLTLCCECEALMRRGYRVRPIAGATTTEIKTRCENCGKRVDKTLMKQFVVGRK